MHLSWFGLICSCDHKIQRQMHPRYWIIWSCSKVSLRSTPLLFGIFWSLCLECPSWIVHFSIPSSYFTFLGNLSNASLVFLPEDFSILTLNLLFCLIYLWILKSQYSAWHSGGAHSMLMGKLLKYRIYFSNHKATCSHVNNSNNTEKLMVEWIFPPFHFKSHYSETASFSYNFHFYLFYCWPPLP